MKKAARKAAKRSRRPKGATTQQTTDAIDAMPLRRGESHDAAALRELPEDAAVVTARQERHP